MLIACNCVTPDKRLIAINDAELDQECSCNCLSRVSIDTLLSGKVQLTDFGVSQTLTLTNLASPQCKFYYSTECTGGMTNVPNTNE